MKNISTAVAAALVLCSCGFMTPAQQYAGDALGAADIAVIKSHVENPFSDEYHATIIGYTKNEATGPGEQKKFGIPGFTDYPSEIHVLAGEYEVQVYCFKGLSSYRPRKTLPLQAGKTYFLTCDVQDGQAVVKARSDATQ